MYASPARLPQDGAPAGVIAIHDECLVEYLRKRVSLCLRALPLASNAALSFPIPAEHHGEKHVLAVKPHPTDASARVWYLTAESQSEAQEWQKALLDARHSVMSLRLQELQGKNKALQAQLESTQQQLAQAQEAIASACASCCMAVVPFFFPPRADVWLWTPRWCVQLKAMRTPFGTCSTTCVNCVAVPQTARPSCTPCVTTWRRLWGKSAQSSSPNAVNRC